MTTNVAAGSSDDIPVLQLAVASDLSLTKLGPLVDDRVVDKLEAVDGVRTVQVTGEDTTRVEITTKAAQLDKYDLTVAGVTQSVTDQLTALPAGTSYDGDSALTVEVGTAPDSVKSVARAPDRHRGPRGQAPRPARHRQGRRRSSAPRSRAPTAAPRSVSRC